ncbi:MAG: PatU [Cyanobacteria bacterium SID2]|nr:PatU [Cyanobacteria bacterium SID2]MBP0003611.1 PatU [Cyanobacteria bacterium SBC]
MTSPSGDDEADIDLEEHSFRLADDLDAPPPVGTEADVSLEFQSIDLGDEPTVQDRFYALLKRRVQHEMQDRLPLFPWETTVLDYDTDPVDDRPEVMVPGRMWLSQLQHLHLPVAIPEGVLSQLLARCQQLALSSLRQGERLVAAVEDLFPDRTDELNLWTERVLIWSASRSGDRVLESSDSADNFPESYDCATPTQQMLLSLLAAKEIVEALSLNVSPDEPTDRRQWVTSHGVLAIEAQYCGDGDRPRLRAACQLPDGGRLRLRGGTQLTTAQRSDAGALSVELPDVELDRTYTLEIHLDASEQSPLTFAICPTQGR